MGTKWGSLEGDTQHGSTTTAWGGGGGGGGGEGDQVGSLEGDTMLADQMHSSRESWMEGFMGGEKGRTQLGESHYFFFLKGKSLSLRDI